MDSQKTSRKSRDTNQKSEQREELYLGRGMEELSIQSKREDIKKEYLQEENICGESIWHFEEDLSFGEGRDKRDTEFCKECISGLNLLYAQVL